MKISILGSGSGGNSTFVESDGTKILIDAGFSCKKIEEKLCCINENLCDIDALLITHEHADHISGAGIISRKYNIPIYITRESYHAGMAKIGDINSENLKFIDNSFILNDNIKATPFDVMHDAERTIGFRLTSLSGKNITISTDIGYVNNIVREAFRNTDVMVIESNYDYNMLMNCSYPFDLKARIKSRNGHLSNSSAAKFIAEMYTSNLKKVFLAHVSKDSNTYKMAKETIADELIQNKIKLEFEVALQDKNTDIFKL
jgi:phosphoribosyl 1,2-cyclic phosphodiesterase